MRRHRQLQPAVPASPDHPERARHGQHGRADDQAGHHAGYSAAGPPGIPGQLAGTLTSTAWPEVSWKLRTEVSGAADVARYGGACQSPVTVQLPAGQRWPSLPTTHSSQVVPAGMPDILGCAMRVHSDRAAWDLTGEIR